MSLVIRIERAHTTAHVGVSPEERARAQALIVTVTLAMDAPGDFAVHDTISETLDYDRVLDFLRHGLDEEAKLIETVADRIAQHCLGLSPRVQSVCVIVEKPSVLQGQGHVCVELERAR